MPASLLSSPICVFGCCCSPKNLLVLVVSVNLFYLMLFFDVRHAENCHRRSAIKPEPHLLPRHLNLDSGTRNLQLHRVLLFKGHHVANRPQRGRYILLTSLLLVYPNYLVLLCFIYTVRPLLMLILIPD